MGRDKILGLSLGILTLGFAAAFCFRPELDIGGPLPQLKSAFKLDQQIAEKPIAPYLTGVEESAIVAKSEPITPRITPPVALQQMEEIRPDVRLSDIFNAPTSEPPFSRSILPQIAAVPVASSAPDPIRMNPEEFVAENRGWEVDSVSRREVTLDAPEAVATAKDRMHRVEKGDTLSKIASRYLGNGARYMDIYEYNKDKLNSPHDLRAGMSLRIPPKNGVPSQPSIAPQQPAITPRQPAVAPQGGPKLEARPTKSMTLPSRWPVAEPAISNPAELGAPIESTTERFSPINRSPLFPRASNASQSAPEPVKPAPKGKKRLSQVPPSGIPAFDKVISILKLDQMPQPIHDSSAAERSTVIR